MLVSKASAVCDFRAAKTSDLPNHLRGKRSQSYGYLLPEEANSPKRGRLTDVTARRRPGISEQVIWDRDLPGFGLRIRESGHKAWIVYLRHRGEQKKVTLGSTEELGATEARAQATVLLRDAALVDLPVRKSAPSTPRFAAYVDEFWRDYALHWKPTTRRRSRYALDAVLTPFFGRKTLAAIERQDVLSFRASRAHRGSSFHTELAVLSAMLSYAEKLGYRQPGSNPCRGVPRFKRPLRERFLTVREYQRLAAVLRGKAEEMPRTVAIVRLLMFTGARRSEIEGLRWEWLTPACARLPDSKTGAKRLYLNKDANLLLDALGRSDAGPIFPCSATVSTLWRDWQRIRRAAAIPDVRLHDLRHSFASVAITHGVSLLTLGRLLGHALPETTARYAHLADEAVQDAADRVCGSIALALGMQP